MNKISKLSLAPFVLCLAVACTSTDGEAEKPDPAKQVEQPPEADSTAPAPEVDTPKPALEVAISVASVQMIEDCPDPPPEPPADSPTEPSAADEEVAPPAAKPMSRSAPKRGSSTDGRGYQPRCEQSTVQLAFESSSKSPVDVEIKAIRVLSKDKQVGTSTARLPEIWQDNRYQPWDASLPPGSSKVSYKLSLPDWDAIEDEIKASSFSHMFTLEIDVVVNGVVQTVTSQEFPREQPHVVVT